MEEIYDNLPWPKLLGPSSSGHQEDLPDPSLLRSKSLFRRHAVDHVDRAISKFHPRWQTWNTVMKFINLDYDSYR